MTIPSLRTRRILVAASDRDARLRLASALRDEGFAVLEASDAAELTGLLEATLRVDGPPAPDLVISDVCMPGAVGFRVAACVRRTHPNVPVMLITAFGASGGVSAQDDAARPGAQALLGKPDSLGALRDLVRRLTRSGA